jgi:dolichol-phosphate mannosyltransferase
MTMLDRPETEMPAPFVSSQMRIEPPWIDFNGHLNMAYYVVFFDRAVDELYELLGLGPAYLAGFAWALDRAYTHIFEMDADGSHPPALLPALLAAAADHDLVLGCRYMPGGGVSGWGLHRRALSRLGNRYARLVLGLPLRDLTGGFKCFRRELLAALPLSTVENRGYAFQIELTYRSYQGGYRIGEVPFVFPDRELGQSKMRLAIASEAAIGLWKMRSAVLPSPGGRARADR